MSQFIFNNTTRVLFGFGKLNNLHTDPLPLSDVDYLEIYQKSFK